MNNKNIPKALESEIYVLGTIMQHNIVLADISNKLRHYDFYNPENQIIYSNMLEMYKNNEDIDTITLYQYMVKKGIGIEVSNLANISQYCAINSYKTHVTRVFETSRLRKIINMCNEVVQADYERLECKSLIEDIENKIIDLANSSSENESILSSNEIIEKAITNIELAYRLGGKPRGIETGIMNIDLIINGLVRGEFTVIGARPSIGKTAFSLNLIDKINEKYKILYVEIDMTDDGIGQRLLASKAKLENGKIGRGILSDDEWVKVIDAANNISSKNNVFYYFPSYPSVSDIRMKIKEMKIKHGVDIVVIDHIGKIKPSIKGSKYEQMTLVSNHMKALAKEMNVALIVLAQLNREVERRSEKKPTLADLRDTGAIEEDADNIAFLYRDGYYKKEEENDIKEDILEVSFQKVRNGRVGNLKFRYNLATQSIKEI